MGPLGPQPAAPAEEQSPYWVHGGPPPMSDPLSSLAGHSVDPGLAGLLGQRAPRSRQPFMVTFFRASPSPIRAPRAVRPLKRRQPKKTNELPHPNKLPGIFGEGQAGPGSEPPSWAGPWLVRTEPWAWLWNECGGQRGLSRGACRGKQEKRWWRGCCREAPWRRAQAERQGGPSWTWATL